MNETTTTRPASWALILAVALGGAFYLAGQHLATKTQNMATISVSADAHVSAVPDIATLTFGITVDQESDAKIAIEKVRKNMTAIIEAVQKADVLEKDIATENFWMNPSYDYSDGRQVLRGYGAGQTLRVKVRNLENVGVVLAAATNAGANQAGDVVFSFDKPEELRAQARNKAINDAKQKAMVLAGDLGVSLGKLQSFNEGYAGSPIAPMMMRSEAGATKDGAVALPIPSGEQEVTVQVTLTYEVR